LAVEEFPWKLKLGSRGHAQIGKARRACRRSPSLLLNLARESGGHRGPSQHARPTTVKSQRCTRNAATVVHTSAPYPHCCCCTAHCTVPADTRRLRVALPTVHTVLCCSATPTAYGSTACGSLYLLLSLPSSTPNPSGQHASNPPSLLPPLTPMRPQPRLRVPQENEFDDQSAGPGIPGIPRSTVLLLLE